MIQKQLYKKENLGHIKNVGHYANEAMQINNYLDIRQVFSFPPAC